ncbi:hypothetical protein PJV90_04135 [Aliarcobacter butzleri]|nr:hypothetical protein [Aliarcobacter butzleri]MDN5127520.1 hypothetical protein [Aliarcobacter butzleri]
MGRQRVSVTRESNTGRNERFHDNYKGVDMSNEVLNWAVKF